MQVVAYGFILALFAALFWRAPRQWLEARRQGIITKNRAYHAWNALSGVVVAAWLLLEWLLRLPLGVPGAWQWVGVGIAAAGWLLALGARLQLADAFYPTAAVRPGGRPIDSGVYGWMRHPFYVGGLTVVFAGALALDGLWSLVAGAVLVPIVWALARLEEEQWLDVGEGYEEYRGR